MSTVPFDLSRRLCVAAPGDVEQRALVSGLDLAPWSERVWLSPERDPAEIERTLAAGELDGAVLPIDAVARARGSYELIPGLAAGSAGPAGVMVLLHRGPLERVRRVLATGRGHAAETLTRLLFLANGSPVELERSDAHFAERPGPAGGRDLAPATALLLTGETALKETPRWTRAGWTAIDLGQAWFQLTGRPFVWAAWAVRPGTVSRKVYGILHGARTRGRRRIPETIDALHVAGEEERARVEAALTRWVRYRLGSRELAGVRHFWREAARVGLLPEDATLQLLPLAAGSACRSPIEPR
jgi:predicted solute-binding protein